MQLHSVNSDALYQYFLEWACIFILFFIDAYMNAKFILK